MKYMFFTFTRSFFMATDIRGMQHPKYTTQAGRPALNVHPRLVGQHSRVILWRKGPSKERSLRPNLHRRCVNANRLQCRNSCICSHLEVYLVHIPALISLFQTKTDEYAQIIKTPYHSDMFQPSKGHPQGVLLTHFSSEVNKMSYRV